MSGFAVAVVLAGVACGNPSEPEGRVSAARNGAGGPSTSAYAVEVDFAQPRSPKPVSGFIHGMSSVTPPAAMVMPLRPATWRIGTFDSTSAHIPTMGIYQRLRGALPATGVQVVLSDLWGYPNYFTRKWPYEDWGAWERFVDSVATVHAGKPVTWDVWNEPDIPQFWPQSAASDSLFRQTYAIAARAIRAHNPAAVIGGPSYSAYSQSRIAAFLDFCSVVDAAGTPRCPVNFLAWHELGPDIPGIATRLTEARTGFVNAARYRALGLRELHVNETVSEVNRNFPGASVNTLYYLEAGGADRAAKTCWGDSDGKFTCDNGSIDGLLTSDFQPRGNWWVYKAYADGVASRVASTASHPNFVALGSRRVGDAPDTAQVLLGVSSPDGAPATTTASIKLVNLGALPFLAGRTSVRVQVWRVPNWLEAAVPHMELHYDQRLATKAGAVTISRPVDMHDAYVVKLLQ